MNRYRGTLAASSGGSPPTHLGLGCRPAYKRGDGSTQVTYNKHPLYYYAGDSQAGQQNGQGLNAFGAAWFAVTPTGGAATGA